MTLATLSRSQVCNVYYGLHIHHWIFPTALISIDDWRLLRLLSVTDGGDICFCLQKLTPSSWHMNYYLISLNFYFCYTTENLKYYVTCTQSSHIVYFTLSNINYNPGPCYKLGLQKMQFYPGIALYITQPLIIYHSKVKLKNYNSNIIVTLF